MIEAGNLTCLLNLLKRKKTVTTDDAYKINIISVDYHISTLISAGFKIKQHKINGVKAYELRK